MIYFKIEDTKKKLYKYLKKPKGLKNIFVSIYLIINQKVILLPLKHWQRVKWMLKKPLKPLL